MKWNIISKDASAFEFENVDLIFLSCKNLGRFTVFLNRIFASFNQKNVIKFSIKKKSFLTHKAFTVYTNKFKNTRFI